MPTTIKYSNNQNSDTAFVVQDGGQKNRAVLTAEPAGTLQLSDSANVSTGYVTDEDGKKHKVNLVAQLEGDIEFSENPNSTKGYATVDGKKHRVVLTASLAGGGSAPVIDELNVTPSTSAQLITAPEGTDGYSPVKVAAVTNSIDVNITAENIKNGVSILGVTGNYGGGASKYGATVNTFLGDVDENGILQNADTSTDIVFTGVKGFSAITATMGVLFRRFQNLDSINSVSFPDLEKIEGTPYAMQNAFRQSSIRSLSLENLYQIITSNAALSYLCANCLNLESVTFTSLKTINSSEALDGMFYNATNMKHIYFPAINIINYTSTFNTYFLSGTTGCTIHLPSNKTSVITSLSGYPNFGGTNTIIAYDLPIVARLQYIENGQTKWLERNPKDDSGSAVAWRTDQTSPIGQTSYYTNGSPSQGDNIYTDVNLTNVLTTITYIGS